MILQALVKLAENEKLIADPDFEFKQVAWIVRLDATGKWLGVEDNRKNLTEGQMDKKGKPAKAKWVGRKQLVPIQFVRTSGDAAFFAVDKAEYVLGVDPAGGREPQKLLIRLNLFYTQFEQCASISDNPSIAAAIAFGKHLSSQSLESRMALLPKEFAAGDLLMLRIGNDPGPIHDLPATKSYWKSVRNPAAKSESSSPADRRCLITSRPVSQVPLFRKIKNVPGDASGGLSLVSFNSSAWESYGWKGEDNAPVTREAAEAAVTSLSRLLDPRPTNGFGDSLPIRRIRMGDDSAIVFWSPQPASEVQSVLDALPDLFDPKDDVADVGNLLSSVRSGVLHELREPAAFYAMTLTSVTGRVVVRNWFETTVQNLQQNLRQHFDDLSCVRNTPVAAGHSHRGVMKLDELMGALAAPSREAKIPTALATAFVNSAFRGTPYPFGLLQRALLRERAEVGGSEWIDFVRRDSRTALIKAVLNRRRRSDIGAASRYSEVNKNMDPTNQNTGYNLGALLAVLERLQVAALDDVNASVVDKYFSAASASPRVTFDRLLRNARHHARKAQDKEKSAGQAFILERLIDEIMSRFNPPAAPGKPIKDRMPVQPAVGLPLSLDLEQQGLFVIGFHHMRRFLWMTREERELWEAEHTDAPRAFIRKRSEKSADADVVAA